MAKSGILGTIELLNGTQRDISPMNDLFLNYLFKDEQEWETLRSILNIVLTEYIERHPVTSMRLVEGDIKVETQYDYYLDTKREKTQDIKITGADGKKLTYVEFQNRANPDTPIKIRALRYYSLGIALNAEGMSNQIWLLAEDADDVLEGQTFANYNIINEVTGNAYQNASGMMFVSLKRLSESDTVAGNLASFLLGANPNPTDERVKEIAGRFTKRFAIFKEDKEVKSKMTRSDEFRAEGFSLGKAEGFSLGVIATAIRLLQKGQEFETVARNLDLEGAQLEAFRIEAQRNGLLPT